MLNTSLRLVGRGKTKLPVNFTSNLTLVHDNRHEYTLGKDVKKVLKGRKIFEVKVPEGIDFVVALNVKLANEAVKAVYAQQPIHIRQASRVELAWWLKIGNEPIMVE